ncbi:double-strand break repair protein AddB [Pikeienuella sp. HZG-20]|uniref:double-strand break repair protein AddB n=1 Tax=Paludibacillus litoralis TaxID=3133267 RepID=UPI0030EE6339
MIRLFDTPGPRVFAAPPGVDFAAELARGLRGRLRAAPPEALAEVDLLINTRRGLRAVRAAFEDAGPAVFLPRLATVEGFAAGRTDAPPPVDRLTRRLTLTRLVGAMLARRPELGPPAAAGPLAEALAALLDECQNEGVPLSALDGAAEDDPAAHWSKTLDFLKLLRDAWPAQLAAEPAMSDPVQRRRDEVAALIAEWEASPPSRPVIAAGSTGSTRITADLLVAIARAPQGAIVLSGFDFALDADGWAEISPDHPQFGHARLLARLGLAPADVRPWAGAPAEEGAAGPRTRLLAEALRPAPVTHRWRAALPRLAAEAEAATAGLELIEASSPAREAEAIALVMREALERPEGRVALVTPDRNLARRVSAALGRWGVTPDDSSGPPLARTPPGVFMAMIAEILCRPFDRVALLALLKHPLAAAGAGRAAHLRGVSRLERRGLRRREVALRLGSIAEIEAAMVGREGEEKTPLADAALRAALAPLRPWSGRQPLAEMVRAHQEAAFALAGPALYEKEAGEALRAALERFARAAEDSAYGDADAAEYPALFAAALAEAGEVREEPWAPHPRLKIWGPLEARSQMAETVVLGGLTEGAWPVAPAVDPWLSRPMRARIGLPPPERRIGLSAHDFMQCAAAPRAILSFAARAGGAPTTPARWLSRLTALLGAVDGGARLAEMRRRGARWTGLAARIGAPDFRMDPAPRPAPRPPAAARPRRLSVTRIETLIRDPYAIYAREVLKLRVLDDPGAPADQRDRGEVLHKVMERFIAETMAGWPGAGPAAALFDRITAETVAASTAAPVQALAWGARLGRVRDWFLAKEAERRAAGRPIAQEAAGELTFRTRGGDFSLNGRADRVDLLNTGELAIYDYKAQTIPTKEQIKIFQKQLPLLALIASEAGLGSRAPTPVGALAYLSLSGAGAGGEERAVALEPDALERLIGLIEAYETEERPYLPRAYPEMMGFASDYDHLSRFGEWEDAAPDAAPPGAS